MFLDFEKFTNCLSFMGKSSMLAKETSTASMDRNDDDYQSRKQSLKACSLVHGRRQSRRTKTSPANEKCISNKG